ncbi:MAG: VIT1/CCC1 transporter family protein [Candidatus Paceibacterota bacterium]|jgi:VIT1/CCC1 family predicted Fe2+/Mn2+ transporter
MTSRFITSDHIRNFVFGVEDSLVSTVGLISGIAIVDTSRPAILLTGAVLIFVEAFSMSVGSLLSDNSVKEFEEKAVVPLRVSAVSAVIMFFSYFLSGFVIIAPYVFLEKGQALPLSIGLSLISLFALGIVSGRMSAINPAKRGLIMAVVGGLAIFVGMAVGLVVSSL